MIIVCFHLVKSNFTKSHINHTSYGFTNGVATNVSRAVSNNITKVSTATRNYVRTLETSTQRNKWNVGRFFCKVKKSIKTL